MQQFDNVVKELRIWLTSFAWVNALMPFALMLMLGGLAVTFIDDLLNLFDIYLSIFNILGTVAYFSFLLGFWLCLIGNNAKYAPYGLMIKGLLILFPFTSIYFGGLITACVNIYLGYQLMNYTALAPSMNSPQE